MPISRGSKSTLSWKPEATYGVAPGGNWNGLSFSSETLGMNINPIISDEIRSDRTVPAVRGGNIAAGGNIMTDFSLTRFGVLLGHLLAGSAFTTTAVTPTLVTNATAYLRGDVVKNANSGGGDYLCTISGTTSGTAVADLAGTTQNQSLTSGTAEFVYLSPTATGKNRHLMNGGPDFPANGISVEKGILGGTDSKYIVFKGGRIDSLALTLPQEGIVKATWALLFAGATAESSTSVAGTPVLVSEDPVTGFECAITVNGVQSDVMRECTLTIPNNIEADAFRIGSRFRKEANPRRREPTGQMTFYFQNEAEYNLFRNETKFALAFSFNHNGEFLSFEFPECKLLGDPVPKIGGAGNVTVQATWHAFKQSSAYDVQLILKNTATGYTL